MESWGGQVGNGFYNRRCWIILDIKYREPVLSNTAQKVNPGRLHV